jgi:hypothetical protein
VTLSGDELGFFVHDDYDTNHEKDTTEKKRDVMV